MVAFNCLARDCPLFGAHLLEASAGTGKTFSIEHIYVRLILEGIEVEQILAITFTRAATRELKARIRANIEKVSHCLRTGHILWEYLQPYQGSEEALRLLSDALAAFDQCQIFTIHGFCFRMLKEYAFEAKVGFSLADPDGERRVPERLVQAVRDFIEYGIDEEKLCPEQMAYLLRQFDSIEDIADRLLRLEKPLATNFFSDMWEQCKAALHLWKGPTPLEAEKLIEDFQVIAKGYKARIKGDFELQVRALAHLDEPASLRLLIREKGTLFAFLHPSNRKEKRGEVGSLHYPGFFDWALTHIAPLMKQRVLPSLQALWHPIAEKILAEEEYFDPDEILKQMRRAIESPLFAEHVRGKYLAAIIDEFQDTDAQQWDIFKSLFLEAPLRALYLVGDPKQSIYRFRKADVYTYLKARDFLGEERVYQLDTNFRSSKSLIDALNALFARNWLHLPKVQRVLPYQPVKAGAHIASDLGDQKGALHFFTAEGEPNTLFEEVFLPFVVSEIEKLQLSRCAILVKDRYQIEKTVALLQARGHLAVAKSHLPIGQTVAFQAVCELFEAVFSPRDHNAARIVGAGPFRTPNLPFSEYKTLLEEKGLVPFARSILKEPISCDVMQIFELLFAWEKREGFSFEGLKSYLRRLKKLKAEEGGARRVEVNEMAVQVMTLHISKGLEFDVVFALGLISRTPETEEEVAEADAEKLRQLYVAMTRAKKRLYVPIALSQKEVEPGTHSPMELFCRHLEVEAPLLDLLQRLSLKESITIEKLSTPYELGLVCVAKPELKEVAPLPKPIPYTPFYLSSFTTLAKGKEGAGMSGLVEGISLQSMPRGTETGIVIHRIFERLFSTPNPIWREAKKVESIVEEEVCFSPLVPWQKVIQEMVKQTLRIPLQLNGEFFSLSELEPEQVQVEMEFVFSTSPHFVTGFIDLIFCHREKVYFLDWKTNWLENYEPASLEATMTCHEYDLQAMLYTEAIQRHSQMEFGGAFYFFVRGAAVYFVRGTKYEL